MPPSLPVILIPHRGTIWVSSEQSKQALKLKDANNLWETNVKQNEVNSTQNIKTSGVEAEAK